MNIFLCFREPSMRQRIFRHYEQRLALLVFSHLNLVRPSWRGRSPNLGWEFIFGGFGFLFQHRMAHAIGLKRYKN